MKVLTLQVQGSPAITYCYRYHAASTPADDCDRRPLATLPSSRSRHLQATIMTSMYVVLYTTYTSYDKYHAYSIRKMFSGEVHSRNFREKKIIKDGT